MYLTDIKYVRFPLGIVIRDGFRSGRPNCSNQNEMQGATRQPARAPSVLTGSSYPTLLRRVYLVLYLVINKRFIFIYPSIHLK